MNTNADRNRRHYYSFLSRLFVFESLIIYLRLDLIGTGFPWSTRETFGSRMFLLVYDVGMKLKGTSGLKETSFTLT